MKNILILIVLLFSVTCLLQAQKLLKSTLASIQFHSHTPLEDIKATSEKAVSAINTSSGTIAFSVANTSFVFPNALMQEHFNEKYMESQKFPRSTFSGKINDSVNWSANGNYQVTVTGKLTVHGITKDRTIPARISISDGKITASSEFIVKTEEHQIEVPKIVWEKIAEEIKVTIEALFPI